MKIAFVSTRGIPNNYGGFEEFVEKLSVELVRRGHDVIVYNPHFHAFAEDEFNGVRIKRKFSPESTIGTTANFLYDLFSLRDAVRIEKCDAAVVCGYTTAAISFFLYSSAGSKLITNVDGLEWKRSKWNPAIQKLAKWFEKIAVRRSDALIADNIGIADYLKSEYDRASYFIPYAGDQLADPDPSVLQPHDFEPFGYLLVVARMEPENNIEMILDGVLRSEGDELVQVVSNVKTKYGKFVVDKYAGNDRIRFQGWVGDRKLLANLRHFAKIHFHGHSVGGTNPSLLEAMASGGFIAAHDNPFNRSVLGEDTLYFGKSDDVAELLGNYPDLNENRGEFSSNNLKKIDELYNWSNITDMYERMFREVVNRAE